MALITFSRSDRVHHNCENTELVLRYSQAKVKLSYSMECSFNCGRFGGIRLRIRTPPVYASAIASHGVTFCFISLKLNEKKKQTPDSLMGHCAQHSQTAQSKVLKGIG